MSTKVDIPLPAGLARLRLRDPALAQELTDDFRRLSHAASAVAWAQGQLDGLLAASTDRDLLAVVVAAARELSGAPRGWALTWRGDLAAGRASFEAVAGDGVVLDAPPALSRTVLGRVAAEGRPAWTDDASEDARFQAAESVQAFALRSVGCVPVGDHGLLWLEDPDRPGRFDPVLRVRIGALCALAGRVLQGRQRAGHGHPVVAAASGPPPEALPGLVGSAPAMHALFGAVRAFAPMPWPALILGETGTGKEAVARALHALSPRSSAPFVPVNCGAIVESLAESTLFGHERGAFTGADRRQDGVLARVGEGTLFLDEVGELAPALQVKLLRVLQEGVYERVGGKEPLSFRGRVVAATHRPLDDAERRGAFREDLFFRLAAAIVRVPPLRERRGDIPALALHLLSRAAAELRDGSGADLAHVALDPAALTELCGRAWPGNVRELENVLRGALARALARGDTVLRAQDLASASLASSSLASSSSASSAASSAGAVPASAPPIAAPAGPIDLRVATVAFQQQLVHDALARNGGRRGRAAAELGVSRQWLHRLLSRWEGEEAG
ncbi:MAG: sigma-54-dependent Fis family transcriptional regulator [Alphaproteobacteria bacterium]|nr:sigma-54-dependent Fis family transcriptional regulator [Alphaproteobacteria bacterium]